MRKRNKFKHGVYLLLALPCFCMHCRSFRLRMDRAGCLVLESSGHFLRLWSLRHICILLSGLMKKRPNVWKLCEKQSWSNGRQSGMKKLEFRKDNRVGIGY